jgi:superfamily II DNA/RNA helicase
VEQKEWVRRYLETSHRLGYLTLYAVTHYVADEATEMLQRYFPDDPNGAAIYVGKKAGALLRSS